MAKDVLPECLDLRRWGWRDQNPFGVPPLIDTNDPSLDDVVGELTAYKPLAAIARKSGYSLATMHRARLAGRLSCRKVFGKWCTTASAIRQMIEESTATAPKTSTNRAAETRSEADRRKAADRAMDEIRSLTA